MKKITNVFSLILASFFVLCGGGGSGALAHDQSGPLRFGVYPYESARSINRLYAPIAERIEKKIGRKVLLLSAPDQNAFMANAREGNYHLALVSPFTLFKVQPVGYQVIARGEPSFYGGVIVRDDSGVAGPEQLRGKKIAAIGRYSYGGYLYFRQELVGLGISPDRDVAFALLDKVDSVIIGVLNKQYDAGVIRLDALNRSDFASVRDKLRVISRSPDIPQFPFVVKAGMEPKTVQAIREVLAAISGGNPEDQEILKSLQIERIVAGEDEDYEAFRHVLEESEQ
jgi:phosphonate transport system substrate-binding protein